ncbi:MAG: MBL fold metallo-hydrolase [Chloroflexi bacterium]|nr:MBL fold metallo-hydrolase [Chloroflexota bacterium]
MPPVWNYGIFLIVKTFPPSSNSSQLVMLGSGTPNAEPERSGPAVAIVVNNQPYLFDFGPGVVRRCAAAYQAGMEGLAPWRLTRAFATHLHSDHTAGFPDLILTPGVIGRKDSLEIYGPQGISAMTGHILEAYREDLRERIEGLEPVTPNAYIINVHEVRPGLFYQDDNVQVTAFPVRHGSWTAYGYKVKTPGRVYVISGDTAPVDTLLEQACGCDVLVHEVYSVKGFSTRPPEWQTYHANMHTSAHELGELAQKAQPKLLILYHQLFWGSSEEELLSEVRSLFDGEVVSAKDLDVF